MFELSRKGISNRENLAYLLAKIFSNWGYKRLARPHVELHQGLKELKQENSVFLYAGLHKSLWDTTGILSALYKARMPIPYTGMGDNLVKGKLFQTLARKAGAFIIKRPRTRKEILESARMLKEHIINFIAHGADVMVYPEGTRKNIPQKGRYGDFFPTAFEAVLEYEKNKDKFLSQNKGLPGYHVYIVPFNIDYSKVREDTEIIEDDGSKPFTLHIFDSLKMLRNIGDTYISFGNPIKIAKNLEKNRKELACYTREKCLELVKILPINIVSSSVIDAYKASKDQEGPIINIDKILDHIKKSLQRLKSLKDRFRNFTIDDNPLEIFRKVSRYEKNFRKIEVKNLKLYQLYANYIKHYFEKED